jgi:hypothetical protein
MRPWLYLSSIAVLAAVACKPRPEPAADSTVKPAASSSTAAGVVVDSALPMPVLLDRFRHDLAKVETLRSDITTRDALVKRVVAALAAGDTAALERTAVNAREYAWLYFPTARVAKPPYEVPPALAWFQVQEKNRRGVLRALRELSGHRVTIESYHCDSEPTVEDQNRVWTGCAVTLVRDTERMVDLKIFGAILERDGRFEVLSYQNDF